MYIVMEIQTPAEGNPATIVTTHGSYEEAQQKYHQILAAAAVSSVAKHSAVVMTDDGFQTHRECYEHG